MSPVRLLLVSAALQILVSSGLGAFLVAALQPWGRSLMAKLPSPRDVVKGHVDWMMLAGLQLGAAFGCAHLSPGVPLWAAGLLVFGSWMNAVPYLLRGAAGVDAFAFAGGVAQRLSASLSGVSSLSLILAWGRLLGAWWP